MITTGIIILISYGSYKMYKWFEEQTKIEEDKELIKNMREYARKYEKTSIPKKDDI
jgi:hypothetical protein